MKKIITISFIVFVLMFGIVWSAPTSTSSTTSKISTSSSSTIKRKLDPYSAENNYGYTNSYLNWYLSGKIKTPPPFGGQITNYIPCALYGVRHVMISGPRPGWYLWTPGVTRTYPFGPPSHTGQWLLGLYAPKYFCVISIQPVNSIEGIEMTMMGSSQ